MMNHAPLMEMAAAARAAILDPRRIALVGAQANPRFELFHAASSLCSQKVRTVLSEKRLSYRSNDMLILGSMGRDGLIPAEHYSPAYVRLRLIAVRDSGLDFVSGYSGRTSVRTEGFVRPGPRPLALAERFFWHRGRCVRRGREERTEASSYDCLGRRAMGFGRVRIWLGSDLGSSEVGEPCD